MNSQISQDIRGVLISVTGAQALLPNATVAEVITYSPPEPDEGSPDWLLGRIRWRGWQLPVISYARMIGSAQDEGEFGAKIVVLKALGGNPRHSYFAMLAQGFPRLVTVAADTLGEPETVAGEELPNGVLMQVRFNDDDVVIPDLGTIETALVDWAQRRAA